MTQALEGAAEPSGIIANRYETGAAPRGGGISSGSSVDIPTQGIKLRQVATHALQATVPTTGEIS